MIHYLHRGIVFLSLSFISPQLFLLYWLEIEEDEVDSFLDMWWQIYLSLRDEGMAPHIIAFLGILLPAYLIADRI